MVQKKKLIKNQGLSSFFRMTNFIEPGLLFYDLTGSKDVKHITYQHKQNILIKPFLNYYPTFKPLYLITKFLID